MAHKRLNYLDIPVTRRKATASKALAKVKESLTSPILTEEQRTALLERMAKLNSWVAGNLEVEEP